MNKRRGLLFFTKWFVLAYSLVSGQSIKITEHISFQDAVWGQLGELENVMGDDGGVLTFFIRNDAATPDSIIHLRFSAAGTTYDSVYWRAWPSRITPAGSGNNYSAITVKGFDFPFRENDLLAIEVWSANGGYDSVSYQNVTPELRIGNVLPSQDMHSLLIYVRNEGAFNRRIDKISINENEYIAGIASELSVWGDDYSCTPQHIRILKIEFPSALTQCAPLALAVLSTRLSDNQTQWTSAAIRVVAPEFPLGTWHSSLLNPGNDSERITIRALNINSTHGVTNPANMEMAYQQYFIRSVWQPDFGNPFNPPLAAATVQANQNADYVFVWAIDDEPDLHGRDIAKQIKKNQTFWENDPNTPSYVNLAVQKKFNRYGWFADIVSMDHYVAPNAPNIIELTWVPLIGRPAEIEEALEYTEYLKFNTEPRRMWSWCQLANSGWDQQATDYTVNHQFWAHIMGGAKGIHWFTAKPGHPTNFPEQWAEAVRLTRQFLPIKNICLYGETTRLSTTSNSDAVSRLLIGPEAMVLIVVNNSIRFTWNGNFNPIQYDSMIDSVAYTVELDVPTWIQPHFMQITENGTTSDGFSVAQIGSARYRITPGILYKKSHVFIIGKADDIPPNDVTGLNVAWQDSCVLSWNEPYDNFGISGYILQYNGIAVDTVTVPFYFVDKKSFICDNSLWKVIAFDAAGNLSSDSITSVNHSANAESRVLHIFPNPSDATVHIFIQTFPSEKIEVFDAKGRLIDSQQLIADTASRIMRINVSDYSPGVYFLKVICKNKTLIQKLIVI
ncbi:MAG: hypothetical protein KatS3mg031_3011 [Chitinophagales bacterium]|nr:MAG: hypothetical protein KatS3mg031_3011 [Chitinophagales bacterium]